MQNNKKKGVAIVSAVIFMTIIVAVSGLLFTLMASLNLKNLQQKNKLQRYITMQQIQREFVANGEVTGEYQYDVEVFNNSNLTKQGVQAVVVKKDSSSSATDLIYYVVYDFDNQKILAEQTQNFYITIKDISGTDFYYLADLVKYKEV